MDKVTLTIDNRQITATPEMTVLEAATAAGIKIPTLCHIKMEDLHYENAPGACRLCVVEVEGRRTLVPSCKTLCSEGMVVHTHTPRVLNARRTIMELILSNHPNECLTCHKNGYCDLQTIAHDLGIREIRYKGAMSSFTPDVSPSIVRNMDKCIMCRRCETACNTIQSVGALSAINRGFPAVVSTAFTRDLSGSTCTYCGQCVAVCPVGALSEHPHVQEVLDAIADPTKTVVVNTAPAVRVGLGDDFGFAPGADVTGKMATALRQLGFDYVFDTDFAADLTIMEEGTELLQRLDAYLKGDKTVKIPLMTSCCPGWVNFMEQQIPEIKEHLSTAKSPHQMFGAIAKNYFAPKIGVDRKNLFVVSVMPCTAKKYECTRPEFSKDGDPDVNVVITTRELAHLIRYSNIDFTHLEDGTFDSPLGQSTGAGVIFGTTGGVIEAAVRTAYELYTGNTLTREQIDFKDLRGFQGVKAATVDFNGTPIKIGIAHGLANARKLAMDVKAGKSEFHAIEVMACPGGCIDGGGQPFHRGNMQKLRERNAMLYKIDHEKPLRKSHDNPEIQQLYKEFLGKPCSHLAHELLHTHYFDRRVVIETTETNQKGE